MNNSVSGGSARDVVQAGSIGSVSFYTQGHSALPDPSHWPLLRDAARVDPGVKGSDTLPYLSRDRGLELAGLIASGEHPLVLVTGSPLTGKTFTAWAALRYALRDHQVCAPSPGADLRVLPDLIRARPGSYALWLDDLTRHLGDHGLDHGLLAQLSSLAVPVVATMSDQEYGEHRFGSAAHAQLLRRARTVELPREWSETELRGLAESPNPRHQDALKWRGGSGVTEFLAVGPELWSEWQWAKRNHPLGHLLVRAAVDVGRCGYVGPIPEDELFDMCRYYKEYDAAVGRETFEDALAWATKARLGVTGLLVAGGAQEAWQVYGSLVAEAVRAPDLPRAPFGAWIHAAHEGDDTDRSAVLTAAVEAYRPEVERGDGRAMYSLALLHEDHDEEEALRWYRRAADTGHGYSLLRVGNQLAAQGEYTEALTYLQRAAGTGDPHAASRLGEFLRDRAEHWLRVGVEGGSVRAAYVLGDMLVGTGATDEALHLYQKAAKNQFLKETVAASLGTLLHHTGDLTEAESWYRIGVEAGDPRAMRGLAALLRPKGGIDAAEAESLLHRAAEEEADGQA
ncbi:tetratricopeptide repeat protein [Streptomyces purpureus]|uniref:tetratricopeptide repeat protein n=1 Tax=Streptomyces purpureus TaxID=1951 RepID=UPI00039D6548|nr:tetratricopeptide repeat protein [Streptomyces purpureus]